MKLYSRLILLSTNLKEVFIVKVSYLEIQETTKWHKNMVVDMKIT